MLKSLARRALNRLAAAIAARMPLGIAPSHANEEMLFAIGAMHARFVAALPDRAPLRHAEFKAFSQWGEDGILQYLVSKVDIPNRFFVEFGVEDYRESNTRFLLQHDNWSGLVMDGSGTYVATIRSDPRHWRYDLTAVEAFVTAENINDLISTHAGARGRDIGLLSIDIDGNDYWVWKAIDVISPRIVVCEYNSLFGASRPVTVPYQPGFQRSRAHHSNLYWGVSLAALYLLAGEKGYVFVGSNSAGNNAFFVRRDVAGRVAALTSEQGYVESRFRESRDPSGQLTYVSGDARLRLIAEMELYDLASGGLKTVHELFADRLGAGSA